jgi:catalase
MNESGRTGEVNFEPSGVHEIAQDPQYKYSSMSVSGVTQQLAIKKPANFLQAGEYYRALSPKGRDSLIEALSGDLNHVSNDANKYAMLSYFYKADADYGTRLAKATHADVSRIQTQASALQD